MPRTIRAPWKAVLAGALLLMPLVVAGCGNKEEAEETPPPPAANQTPPTATPGTAQPGQVEEPRPGPDPTDPSIPRSQGGGGN